MPAEVQRTDTDREKTYLQDLPDLPDNVYCLRWYDTSLPTLVGKQTGVYYVQVIVRNKSHAQALTNINKLWRFLINRSEPIEDIAQNCWVIFDVQSGPIDLGRDKKGNYLYSLNIPIKTNMF